MIDLIAGPNTEVSWPALPARRYFWQGTRANSCKSHLWCVRRHIARFRWVSHHVNAISVRCSVLKRTGEIRLQTENERWKSHRGEISGEPLKQQRERRASCALHGSFLVAYRLFEAAFNFWGSRFLTHMKDCSRDFARTRHASGKCK